MIDPRLAFRATPADMTHLATIAAAMRAAGQPFATRTDVLRYALATVAAAAAETPRAA